MCANNDNTDTCKECQKHPIYSKDYSAKSKGYCFECWNLALIPIQCKVCQNPIVTFDASIKERKICSVCFNKASRQTVKEFEKDIEEKEQEIKKIKKQLSKPLFRKSNLTNEQRQEINEKLERLKKDLEQLKDLKERRKNIKVEKIEYEEKDYDEINRLEKERKEELQWKRRHKDDTKSSWESYFDPKNKNSKGWRT